jgi:hypothetical protein
VEALKKIIIMDPNVTSQDTLHTSDVDNVVVYRDWLNPEPITDKVHTEYIEDEWDNILGDVILFV